MSQPPADEVTVSEHPLAGEEIPSPGSITQEDARPERSDFNPLAAPGTYTLLAINFAVFLVMFPRSPGLAAWHDHPWAFFITGFTPDQLTHFGATGTKLVLDGQWFRLVSAIFVHVNPLHLLTNMWCLWNLGLLGEPLVGPLGLIAVYVLTGAAGNLLSIASDVCYALYFHEPVLANVSAGASGAVFGIAGILIVLLSNRKLPIPWPELKQHRLAVVLFSVVNLFVGGLSIFFSFVRIDNAAHVGGFLCGLALGVPLIARMTAGKVRYLARQRIVFVSAAFVLSLFGYWVANLR